jgi:hypothetical protein
VPILRRLAPIFLAATLTTLGFPLGCHAQNPAPANITLGSPLPYAIKHKVEVLLRQKAQLPPASTISIGPATPSEVNGYSSVAVSFTSPEGKTSNPVLFLVSNDGKTVAQFTKFDISADPRALVSPAGRPPSSSSASTTSSAPSAPSFTRASSPPSPSATETRSPSSTRTSPSSSTPGPCAPPST